MNALSKKRMLQPEIEQEQAKYVFQKQVIHSFVPDSLFCPVSASFKYSKY